MTPNKNHHPIHRFFVYLKYLIKKEGELKGNHHKKAEAIFLLLRNALVLVAAILFILGMTHIHGKYMLKGIGYILGGCAYFCELLILNDCFSKKLPIKEKFMVYCFGPLYFLMAISYIIEHLGI